MNRFRSRYYCWFFKLFSKRVNHRLITLYFLSSNQGNTNNTIAIIDAISYLLNEQRFIEDKKRLKNNIKSILIADFEFIDNSWSKHGDIMIKFGKYYSGNYLFMLGALIFSISYQADTQAKTKK